MLGHGNISLGLIEYATNKVKGLDKSIKESKTRYKLPDGSEQMIAFKKVYGTWYFDADTTLKETRKLNSKKKSLRTVEEVD